MDRKDLWLISERMVRDIGISVAYKGFYYLICAVVISTEIGMRKGALAKEIYENISVMYSVSVESVEKCIRSCISRAWNDDPMNFSRIYEFKGRKPTNGEVIASISSRIRLESGS